MERETERDRQRQRDRDKDRHKTDRHANYLRQSDKLTTGFKCRSVMCVFNV